MATIEVFTAKDICTAGAWQENVVATISSQDVPAAAAVDDVITRTTIDGVVEGTHCHGRFWIQGD